MAENGKNERNFLDHKKAFRLHLWLEGKREEILENRPTFKDLARQAAEELQFPVTITNVSSAKEVVGLEWTPKKSKYAKKKRTGGGGRSNVSRVLTANLQKVAYAVSDMASALCVIAQELGAGQRISEKVKDMAFNPETILDPLEELWQKLNTGDKDGGGATPESITNKPKLPSAKPR